jgi:hypothetical protein
MKREPLPPVTIEDQRAMEIERDRLRADRHFDEDDTLAIGSDEWHERERQRFERIVAEAKRYPSTGQHLEAAIQLIEKLFRRK